jgi:Fe-S-cluster-containing hydrogenase component 2/CRP-like cAMP-binding protein
VWESPWLRGIDAVARAHVEAAGRVHALEKGARVFGVGDPADAFFVVGSGLVEVRAVRRGETEPRALRRAVAGDALGEEAIVRAGAPRAAEATCATRAVVAEVPVAVLRRALGRAGPGGTLPMEEALRRAAARDVVWASAIGRALSERDVEALVAAAEHRQLARGEVLFAQGDPATHAYVVADGMVQVGEASDGRARVRAYLARGDLAGDGALEAGNAHAVTVTASGPAWVLAIGREAWMRVARRVPETLARARRLTWSQPLPEPGGSRASGLDHPTTLTRHVLGDLWRFAEAGSMLVIDDEACVRCGHCAWSCAAAHGDGVSRLVRRGEKVVVRDASDGTERALVIPGGCQHCKHPACMLDCPTGAIGRDTFGLGVRSLTGVRDPGGDVFVREDLCVGCGRCVKACPWGSVQMAPRAAPERRRLPVVAGGGPGAPSPDVAVKCDMCHGVDGGPACVSACPVDAIARVDPSAAIADVRRAIGGRAPRQPLPERRAGWPWVIAAAVAAVGLAHLPAGSGAARVVTGVVAGALVLALTAYALVKRGRLVLGSRMLARERTRTPTRSRMLARERTRTPARSSTHAESGPEHGRAPTRRSRTSLHAVAHVALGVLAVGLVAAHAGAHIAPNAAGALLAAFAIASASGAAGAVAYRLLPRALSRVERRAMLPEDLVPRARDLDDRVFGALTGRSEATKAVYARWLAPYAHSPLGGLALVVRRATLRDEEARLRGRVERVLGARAATLDGLRDLVRLVVERRAVRAQRLLQGALRAWVPVHVVAVAVTLALLVVHVACVVRGR